MDKAYKEKEGKLFYELDWDFITQMAERMASNKGKYEPYNWKKLDNVEDLKQALFRHVIDIMKGNYEDDGREFGHLEAAADDLMMINYQLRNNYNKLAVYGYGTITNLIKDYLPETVIFFDKRASYINSKDKIKPIEEVEEIQYVDSQTIETTGLHNSRTYFSTKI